MQPAKTPEPAKPTHASGERSERSNAPAVQQPGAIATRPPASPIETLLTSASFKRQMAAVLPEHLKPERMARVALTECRKNPLLLRCTPESFMSAMLTCSELGLEPGSALGLVYLIPFKHGGKSKELRRDVYEIQVVTGFRGELALVRRSGQLLSINAWVAHENDKFSYRLGMSPDIQHEPAVGDPGKPTHAYAVARLRDGGVETEVMSFAQIEKVRARSGRDNPVWRTDWEEMARKTVIRRIAKRLPKSVEYQRVLDAAAGVGPALPGLDVAGLLEDTASVTYEPDPEALEAERQESAP